uniref:Uncharacterized protein n=1 Tax=Anguilla anguilla TaxID=7936 RepID=A0A0E9QWM8_ANGAN
MVQQPPNLTLQALSAPRVIMLWQLLPVLLSMFKTIGQVARQPKTELLAQYFVLHTNTTL